MRISRRGFALVAAVARSPPRQGGGNGSGHVESRGRARVLQDVTPGGQPGAGGLPYVGTSGALILLPCKCLAPRLLPNTRKGLRPMRAPSTPSPRTPPPPCFSEGKWISECRVTRDDLVSDLNGFFFH